ncbi:MAG: MBL fold metallo-hydrolase [Clostridia bacterium]|nr:MBL fold metallo-hydrolase [Clostridia bacterium]
MKIQSVVGILRSNTYIVWSRYGGECMIVDCGAKAECVNKIIEENKLRVKYIVLTHGHYDHADYIEEYIQLFKGAVIACHEDEIRVLYDVEANLSYWGDRAREYRADFTLLKDGDTLTLEKDTSRCLSLEVIHTPGHTPGSICLYSRENRIMLTGDTLFDRCYGRFDFKYGSFDMLMSSLEHLRSIDGSTVIYPGHDKKSTLGLSLMFLD